MDSQNLGRKIKALRKELGLTQNQLAERLDISFQQVQKYEKGDSRITVSRLSDIADALETSIMSFLVNDKTEEAAENGLYGSGFTLLRVSREEAALLKLFRKLNNEKFRASLLQQIKGLIELESDHN